MAQHKPNCTHTHTPIDTISHTETHTQRARETLPLHAVLRYLPTRLGLLIWVWQILIQEYIRTYMCLAMLQVNTLPVSHSDPAHPATQVQVSTSVQVPPFWQGLEHEAVIEWKGHIMTVRNGHLRTYVYNSAKPLAYMCTEVHSHSTAHWTGRFYCLIPAVCSLHHRCRSLQSCRLY